MQSWHSTVTKQQLYLEIYVSGVGLGISLQARDRMQSQRNEVPKNAVLWPIAFTSKSLTTVEVLYNNTEREALGILHGLEKFHHYCFTCEVSVTTDHQLLVAICNKRFCKAVTQASKNVIINASLQHMNTVQAWATIIYCRLAIKTQPGDEQIERNYFHLIVMYGHIRLNDIRRKMNSNTI